MFRIIALLTTLPFASCTYAPRSTSIDNNYNARQMAIGVGEQSQDAMTSTIHEEEAIGEGDSSNTPSESNPSQEAGLQESHASYVSQEQRPAVSAPSFITIGSSKSHVARIQGTPKTIDDLSIINEECWHYDYYNRINFKNGRVSGWNNSNGKLKVRMGFE